MEFSQAGGFRKFGLRDKGLMVGQRRHYISLGSYEVFRVSCPLAASCGTLGTVLREPGFLNIV